MDIFKLFFDNDLRLDTTVDRSKSEDSESRLEDFMSPTPTFSKFYLTGTRLDEEAFGLNRLKKHPQPIKKLDDVFEKHQSHTLASQYSSFSNAVEQTEIGQPIMLSTDGKVETDLSQLVIEKESNVGHLKEELRKPLSKGYVLIYKEQAKNGFDLHVFSKDNIYKQLFYPLRELVDSTFRFFSINSKRMRSERHFYFETWTLDRPPHGAEEVFTDTEYNGP